MTKSSLNLLAASTFKASAAATLRLFLVFVFVCLADVCWVYNYDVQVLYKCTF